MVRDGIYYATAALTAAVLLGWLAGPAYSPPLVLAAAFLLWFFRDPDRRVPDSPGAIVSPADGKVTDVSTVTRQGVARRRISIFLSVFDVHVNRSPIAGIIRAADYRRGEFRNALRTGSSAENEQNVVTVEGDGQAVIFKQIAGLLARRIVFTPTVGQAVARGERVGMIKFGSRVDVLLDPDVEMCVKVGDRVKGGASILAMAPARSAEPAELLTAQRDGAR